jgi:4-hydroxy-tetrahydrodipicolinate synthase
VLEGVITPIVTLFDKQGYVDYDAESHLVEYLLSKGINGILFMGSTGEFPYLSTDERKEFIDFAVKQVSHRAKVLVGTGSTYGRESLELTQYASKAGADYAMVITPYYFNYEDDTYYRYYEFLANNSDIPIMIYNYPALTGYCITPGIFKNIIEHIPAVVGIKDTIDSLSHIRAIIDVAQSVRREIHVFCGFDDYLLPTLSLGGSGVIGGISNFAPDVLVGLYKEYRNGNITGIESQNRTLSHLMKLYGLWKPGSTIIKEALLAANIISEDNMTDRIPAGRMPYDKLYELKTILRTYL